MGTSNAAVRSPSNTAGIAPLRPFLTHPHSLSLPLTTSIELEIDLARMAQPLPTIRGQSIQVLAPKGAKCAPRATSCPRGEGAMATGVCAPPQGYINLLSLGLPTSLSLLPSIPFDLATSPLLSTLVLSSRLLRQPCSLLTTLSCYYSTSLASYPQAHASCKSPAPSPVILKATRPPPSRPLLLLFNCPLYFGFSGCLLVPWAGTYCFAAVECSSGFSASHSHFAPESQCV